MPLLLLLACSQPATVPMGPGADLRLPMRWSQGMELEGEATFTLDTPAGAGTVLRLDGTWWAVAPTLDGQALPTVTPGLAPLEMPLPTLAAGAHTLSLRVSMPGNEPPVVTLPNKNRSPTGGIVTLRLQQSASLGAIAVPLRKGQVAPVVTVSGAPDGATVELEIGRDGERLAHWGPASAESELAPQRWSGSRWGLGAPELYVATATLRDAAGVVLAQRSVRVGLRETSLVEGVPALNGARLPIWAVRGQPSEDPAQAATLVASGGLDAVELHGAIATDAWFGAFDEWGLPIVQVARCDGKLWAPGEDPTRVLRGQSAVLADQDTRLFAASAARPSVIAWSCEGSGWVRELACGNLRNDPLGRTVLGLDVPGITIAGDHAPAPTGPTWIIEVGGPPGGVLPSPTVTAATFGRALGKQGAGGVVPVSGGAHSAAWAPAWTEAARAAGVQAWAPGRHRAMSVVTVDGLKPGQIAVLHAPGLAPTGAVADTSGVATIEAWYKGKAVVLVGGVERPVEVVPDRWEGTKRAGP